MSCFPGHGNWQEIPGWRHADTAFKGDVEREGPNERPRAFLKDQQFQRQNQFSRGQQRRGRLLGNIFLLNKGGKRRSSFFGCFHMRSGAAAAFV